MSTDQVAAGQDPAREGQEAAASPPEAERRAARALESVHAADTTGVNVRALAVVAVLAPDGVRRDVLHAAGEAGVLTPGRHQMTVNAVDELLAGLTGRSLLALSPDGRTVVMPRPVAGVTRSWLARRGRLAAAGLAAADALEAWTRTFGVTHDHAAARDLPGQVAALAGQVTSPAGQDGEELAMKLLRLRFLALYYLIELGDDIPQAIAVGEPLTADLEQALGAAHPATLNARNSLAAAYLAAGRAAEAVPLFQRTLLGRERTLGPDHPDTLISQNNLAAAYQDAGRLDEAILLFRLTLAARQQRLGAGHRDTLNSRANLAAAYRTAGRPGQAVPLLAQVLTGRERLLGAGHPDTQAARDNLDQARREANRPPVSVPPPEEFEPAEELRPAEQFQSADAVPPRQDAAALPEAEQALPEAEQALPEAEPPAEEPQSLPARPEPVPDPEPPVAIADEAEEPVSAERTAEPGPEAPAADGDAADEHAAVWAAIAELVAREPAADEPDVDEPAFAAAEAGPALAPVPDIPGPRPPAESGPPASGPPGRRGLRLPWVAAAVVVLIVASGAAGALSRLHSGHSSPGPAGRVRTQPADPAQLAANWVAQQVSRGVTVACDPLMCAALEARGVPTARLLVLRTGTASPRGAGVVVATPAVRSQFGARLDSEYAPAVIAGFGSGPGQVQVQVVAPDGAPAYRAALRQDQAARKVAGTELLANKQIGVTDQARAQLGAGAVDSRLLILLPTLAATHPVQVLAFAGSGPGAGSDAPLCAVNLSGSGRAAGMTDAAYQSWLTSFVRAQLDRFTGNVTVIKQAGQPVVRVEFAAPSPLGLLDQ